jgi:peptide/nickel transport system permease protein
VIFGARVSIFIAGCGVLVSGIIGLILGTISGYFGSAIDKVLLRISEIFNAFPIIVLALLMVTVIGPKISNLIIIFGVINWAKLYRLVRAKFLSLREEEFVEALRALSISHFSIMFKHMLTNTLGPITVWATVTLATCIIQEASLSFLGLGVQIPMPSLGNLISEAQDLQVLREYVWLWITPGVMIAVITLCFNFVGDGLRDVFDPRVIR